MFAINAVDDGPRNFTAFQNVAEVLNGTIAGAIAAPSATGSTTGTTGGALSVRVSGGAGVVVALIAIAASLL